MPTTDPIEHIIVLMLENRSFDHILGSLRQTKGIEGVDPNSPGVNTYSGVTYSQTPTAPRLGYQDPKHDLKDALAQIDIETNGKPLMDGFVQSYATEVTPDRFGQVMEYFPPLGLPVLHELATEFTVCDRWFSSLPGPTWPNRLFAMSGTSLGKVTMPGLADPFDIHLYDQTTVYDRLNEKGIAWKVYFGDIAVSMVLMHQCSPQNAARHRPTLEFYDDLNDTTEFPSFAWIEPSYLPPGGNDYHPPHDVFSGEKLVADIYNALRSSSFWNSSLLVILFDEHGGFYDHIPPPPAVPPDDRRDEWTFDRLGVRVPAILVSPWVGNGVLSDVFDHTSILRYLSDKWELESLGQRTANANGFARAFSQTSRDDTLSRIATPSVESIKQTTVHALTGHEEAMVRLSRALESMAGEDANVIAVRSAQDLLGPAGQAASAIDRVGGFLRKLAP